MINAETGKTLFIGVCDGSGHDFVLWKELGGV
jgi:hypothetical protein